MVIKLVQEAFRSFIGKRVRATLRPYPWLRSGKLGEIPSNLFIAYSSLPPSLVNIHVRGALSGLPLVAWTHRLKEDGDGRNAQEVRSGFPGGRGAAGAGDWQADRAGGEGPGDQFGDLG